MRNKQIKLSAIAVVVLSCGLNYASENAIRLQTIVVSGSQGQSQKIGEIKKTAKMLGKQQTQDSREVVRYETGVTVVENGRFGTSGYAIRGVDENRVAIQVDGLAQAETISSQGFKELFEGYGNFNNTRNGAEIETLKQVIIRKGADGVRTGSGSLGGAVIFETKDARDYLTQKNYHFSYKRGYSSADNHHLNRLSLAGRYKWFDALVVATKRDADELKNFGYKSYASHIQGKKREKADPYQRSVNSTLLKVGFQPNEENRLSVMADLYQAKTKGNDFSYTLKHTKLGVLQRDEVELRHVNDKIVRQNYAITFENFTQNPFYDSLKLTYSNQKITTRARTDEYCDGNEKCEFLQNKFGLKYNKNNQLVDKNNTPIEYVNIQPYWNEKNLHSETVTLLNKEELEKAGKYWKYDREIFRPKRTVVEKRLEEQFKLNPNATVDYECDPSSGELVCAFTVKENTYINKTERSLVVDGMKYDLNDPANEGVSNQIDYNLSTYNPIIYSCDAVNCELNTIKAFYRDKIVDVPFKVIEREGKKYAQIQADRSIYTSQLRSPVVIRPNNKGYLQNIWTERDLNTKTHQINLDLTKEIEFWATKHALFYGGLWSKNGKSMVNTSGDTYLADSLRWWAVYPQSCKGTDKFNSLCSNQNTYSFLIPVKNVTNALYFGDDIRFNDWLGIDWAYRYDKIRYKPIYVAGVTPKLPDEMVKLDPSLTPKENIQRFSQPKKYSAKSYSVATTFDPLPWLRLQAKYGKGFRVPTSDEIYFTFLHPDLSIKPNVQLREETAKTKEATVTLHHDVGFLTFSAFETNYKNFIDLQYKGELSRQVGSQNLGYAIYQNTNRPAARVSGIELQSKIFLGRLFNPLEGVVVGYKYTYQKGRMAYDPKTDIAKPTGGSGIPMNAIQPKTSVFSLGYDHPSERFGADIYITHVEKKANKDSYNRYHSEERAKSSYAKWLSQSYTTIDTIVYVKPIKSLTLQLGVYNLTNRKYATWDSLRSIKPFGTANRIDNATGEGINRFYAPERNFRLSGELTF
ncbi:hemoglobin/transferrin/lactoferrin receptor protein [Nicoletella semolina]|uniref:Hemoglobin/transferrin/lactoferrin receptor protein n=1 Tax=Nicoletella semolina TaxID=271160 RepID=A0A4V2SJK5_9PAST|nr:TonB-dependent hemoglobin/transferrin/lactoferrin family receptor [Nicoletella semolina]MDH2924759.1 ligand-gated channel protein [Nicoletella semolina]TCP15976.1 hemoglobin/transferrin/lactoferrin receptor protein [Nicoletella semolina]